MKKGEKKREGREREKRDSYGDESRREHGHGEQNKGKRSRSVRLEPAADWRRDGGATASLAVSRRRCRGEDCGRRGTSSGEVSEAGGHGGGGAVHRGARCGSCAREDEAVSACEGSRDGTSTPERLPR